MGWKWVERVNERGRAQWRRLTGTERAGWNSWCHFGAVRPAKVRSNTALWEKWFQKLVITALITYSALSFPPPFLTLPPSSLFISASTWLRFSARRLSLCHPPYGSFPSLCEAMEIVFFFFQLFHPSIFAFVSQTSFFPDRHAPHELQRTREECLMYYAGQHK